MAATLADRRRLSAAPFRAHMHDTFGTNHPFGKFKTFEYYCPIKLWGGLWPVWSVPIVPRKSSVPVPKMVRPRASPQNLSIAVSFGKMILVQMDSAEAHKFENTVHVSCNGNRSIFAAFAACFPDLVRSSRDKQPRNRQGVAAIELNKSLQAALLFDYDLTNKHMNLLLLTGLQAAGLKAVRKQERVDGADGARWRPKVTILKKKFDCMQSKRLHFVSFRFRSESTE